MTNLINSVYTKEREDAMEQNRQKYNQALQDGNKELAKYYGEKMLHQISEQWVDIHVRPTGMLKK